MSNMERQTCHDCGVAEGELHRGNCDMERCPICEDQAFICGCDPPDDCYRIPYIQYPVACAKCGALWPDFFRVPDDEWKGYIEPRKQDKVICRSCYDQIRAWIGTARTLLAPDDDEANIDWANLLPAFSELLAGLQSLRLALDNNENDRAKTIVHQCTIGLIKDLAPHGEEAARMRAVEGV